MKNFYISILLLTSFLIFNKAGFGEELRFNCERTKIDNFGFNSLRAAESWYRKNILVRIDIDKEKAYLGSSQKYSSNVKVKSEGKRFDIVFRLPMRNGPDSNLAFYFLPSGRVDVQLKGRSGYKDPGGATYKCSNWPMN